MKKIVLGCAAVLLSLGLLAGCNKEEENTGPGPVVENPDSGNDGGDTGSEAETTLVKLGAFTDNDASWHFVDGGLSTASTPCASTTTSWESAPWITVTKVTGGATLSIEEEGKATQYLVYGGSSTTVNYSTDAYTWAWSEEYETFATNDGTRAFGLNTTYNDVRAYAVSSFTYDVVEVLTEKPADVAVPTSYTEVTTLEEGGSYLLGIEIGDEDSKVLYFFNGKVQNNYYLDVTPSYKNAVEVTLSAVSGVENGYGLNYTLNGAEEIIYAYHEGTHTTVICGPESNVPAVSGDVTEVTTTFIWNGSINGFTVSWSVADTTHTTASFSSTLGLPSGSTFTEITLTEDESPIAAHLYTPVFDTLETPAE